jgi:hypothetical protein
VKFFKPWPKSPPSWFLSFSFVRMVREAHGWAFLLIFFYLFNFFFMFILLIKKMFFPSHFFPFSFPFFWNSVEIFYHNLKNIVILILKKRVSLVASIFYLRVDYKVLGGMVLVVKAMVSNKL